MSPPNLGLDFVSTAATISLNPTSSRASSPMFYPPYPASFSDDSHELPSCAEFSSYSHSHSGSTTSAVSFTPFGLVIPLPPPPSSEPASGSGSGSEAGIGKQKPSMSIPSLNLKMKMKFRRNSDTMFSKSDEIRLRLALAREVGGGMDVKVDKGYVYQDQGGSGGSSMANVKMQMRRLSKGLKDLVMVKRRSDC